MRRYSSLLLFILCFIYIGCTEQPKDCLGTEGGSATLDNCGTCDNDPTNDCSEDCMGVWGGSANEDLNFCGHCDDNYDCSFLGYMNQISFYPGEVAELYISTRDTMYNANLGIFDINGNMVESFSITTFPQQINNDKPWENGFGFIKTTDFEIPQIESGIYFIAENFSGTIYKNKIPFIVKAVGNIDLMIIYPSNTGNAYNAFGGRSLYTSPRATTVSFMRPQYLRHFSIHFLKWIANQPYNIGYASDFDIEDEDILKTSKLLLVPGHSEYWSRNARKNFDDFIDQGDNAIFLSGNNMWWQVRYSENGKKMICYKSDDDPIENPLLETIHWFEPSLNFPILKSLGADYYQGGYGIYNDYGWDGFKIVKPNSPIFSGCNLSFGEIIYMPHVELDSAPISHFLDDGTPVIDEPELGFYKIELLAYDLVSGYDDGQMSPGTFIAFQKTENSGVIINTSSTNWCKEGFNGMDNNKVKIITTNMIDLLLNDANVFSD